jgi:hypothetical protein
MTKAAGTPDSGMGAGIGAGLGMGIGAQMAAQAAGAARPAAAPPPAPGAQMPPPPPPAETVWHIAENGQTRGPFAASALRPMVAAGTLTRVTMVWTAGQDGWRPAGEVPALAPLFATVPPPPPPGV